MADFYPIFKSHLESRPCISRNIKGSDKTHTVTSSDTTKPPENQLELPSIQKLRLTENSDESGSTIAENGPIETLKNFYPIFKSHSESIPCISRNIKGSDKTHTVTSSDTTKPPENQLELPSIEKLRITENSDESGNTIAENGPIETLKNSAQVVGKNEKAKITRRLHFKATPANSGDLKGFDKIFGWCDENSIKPEERNGIPEEKQREELLKVEKLKTPPSKNYTSENPQLQVSCCIAKDVLKKLIESYSIKDHHDEDFINRFFRIESAFYNYLELHVFKSSHLDKCTLYTFAWHIHNLEPSLKSYLGNLSNYYTDWKKYKYSLPTYGAVLISEDNSHVVMVQSSICKKSWGFPKGKVISKEDRVSCAIREVREEIGFNIQHLIREDNYIEYHDAEGRKYGLYVIEGISMKTPFMSKSKYEIRAIEWKSIEELVKGRENFLINATSRHFIAKLKTAKIIPKNKIK